MNINQLKLEISSKSGKPLPVLTMVRQLTPEGEVTPWLSHWDNDNRIRVSMHEEIFNAIKSNPKIDTLAVKKQVVEATEDREAYLRFVVITPKNIEATF